MSVMREGVKINDDGSLNVTFASGSTIDSPTFTGTRTGVTYPLAQSFAAVSAPADTNEDTLATITIPANALGANGCIRIYTLWTVTNNGNGKTARVRYSGAAGTIYMQAALANVATCSVLTIIGNRSATNSQVGNTYVQVGGLGTATSSVGTSAVDTTAATTVVITAQKITAGDTMTLEGYVVEVARAS